MGQDEQELIDFLDFVEKELASAKARDKYEQEHVEKLEEIKMKIKQKMENMKNKSDNSQYSYRPSPEQQKREREEQEQWREAVRQRARQEEERRRAQMEELKKAREAREKEEEAARQRQQADQERQKKEYAKKMEMERQIKEWEEKNRYTFLGRVNIVLRQKLKLEIHYYKEDKKTLTYKEVVTPTDTDEFYTFIQNEWEQILKSYETFIAEHKNISTKEINEIDFVMDYIFQKVNAMKNRKEREEKERRKAKQEETERRYQEETPGVYNWNDLKNKHVEDFYFKNNMYKKFFELLNIDIKYTINSKEVTEPMYAEEFYDFIKTNLNTIKTKWKAYMLQHKKSVLGNDEQDSLEAQKVRLVNDVKDHIFRKLFISANIAYILKLLHKRLQALEARAGSDLPPRRCSRIAG